MPPYCPRQKIDYDDNIIIVLEVTPRRINFILQDMGVGSISGKMLKNPHGDEKTKSSVQKRRLVQDMKSRTVQKRSQVTTLRK